MGTSTAFEDSMKAVAPMRTNRLRMLSLKLSVMRALMSTFFARIFFASSMLSTVPVGSG